MSKEKNAIVLPAYAFEVPNIDDCSIDPDDYEALARVFGQLSDYASLKASAMRARLKGDIQFAIRHENGCERIYKQLPEWARW